MLFKITLLFLLLSFNLRLSKAIVKGVPHTGQLISLAKYGIAPM